MIDANPDRGVSRAFGFLIATGFILLLHSAADASPCPGDCNVDAGVTINELVSCVNIALGSNDRASCVSCDPNNDGAVAINEIVSSVSKALSDCRPEFAEASVGVISTGVEAVESLQLIDLGYAGALVPRGPSLRGGRVGGAAGPAQCITCPDGGRVDQYTCVANGGVSTLDATLLDCVDAGTTRNGGLRLAVNDPDFCNTCAIPLETSATQTLTAFTETTSARQASVAGTLTESFTLSGQGCREEDDRAILDRTSTYTGTLRVAGAGTEASFEYDGFTTAIASARDGQNRCVVTTTQNGIVRVDDQVADRRFTQVAEDFEVIESESPDGSRELALRTLPGGRLSVDCLGGGVEVRTIEALRISEGGACPTAGLLRLTLADLPSPVVTATRYTSSGGVEIDLAFDGNFNADDTVLSCRDAALTDCRVDLPAAALPPTRTATATATAAPVTRTPTATCTASESPTSVDTPTTTETPSATLTAADTGTPTGTPTVAPTGTPSCRTTIDGGLVVNETWTMDGSPYCITNDLDVSLLTIEPGVDVLVDGPYEIEVLSTIRAEGTAAAPIRFAPRSHLASWKGLRFQNTPPGSVLSHCIVEWSGRSGITLTDAAGLSITNCAFRNNRTADNGGAIDAVRVTGNLILAGCTFTDNEALNGGALHVDMSSGAALLLSDSEFLRNRANANYVAGFAVGGALWLEQGDATISTTRFSENRSNSACYTGFVCGVVARGGALYLQGDGSIAIESSQFIGNQADAFNGGSCFAGASSVSFGAGVFVESGVVSIANSILSCNLTTKSGAPCAPSNDGGGLFVNGGATSVGNSVVARHPEVPGVAVASGTLEVDSSILYFNNGTGAQISGTPVISYSNVQGGADGEGNINLNPVFAGPGCEPDDLRIVLGSPCIDSGNPNPAFNDACFPPSLGASRNDMGAFGGPGACAFVEP